MLALLAVGVALLAVFVVLERRRAAPMLDMALFASPAFVAATVGALATGMGIIATTSFLPTVVERGLGSTALVGALLLLAWSGTSVVTAVLARRLPAAWSGRLQLAAGLLVVAAGQALLLGLAPGDSPLSLVPGLAVAGAASGMVNAALGREAVASVPAGRGAMGGGANNTARYVGSAIGTTVVAVVATRPLARRRSGRTRRGLERRPADRDRVLAGRGGRRRRLPPASGAPVRDHRVTDGHDRGRIVGHGQVEARRDPGPAQVAVQGRPRVGRRDAQGRR